MKKQPHIVTDRKRGDGSRRLRVRVSGQSVRWRVGPARAATRGVRVVRNGDGYLLTVGGEWIDPATLTPGQPEPEWQRETFGRNIAAELAADVKRFHQAQRREVRNV